LVPCRTIQSSGRFKVPSILVKKGRRGEETLGDRLMELYSPSGKKTVS
jgi:hypothetical protein